MKKLISLLLPVSLLLGGARVAPPLPQGADVWLFDCTYANGKLQPGGGYNVSSRKGYDDQPSFSEGGSYLVYTSEQADGQTDIMRFDPVLKLSRQLTSTAVSEYSPQYIAGNKFLAAVVVEKDSSQRIWRYHKITGESKVLIPKIYAVGYQCWFDASTVFLFQIGDPNMLVLANARNGNKRNCVTNPGRCMQTWKSPRKKLLLYTQMNEDSTWSVKALNKTGMAEPGFQPVKLPAGTQDFAVDAFNNLIAGQGSKLMSYNLITRDGWQEITDLRGIGFRKISRIAISRGGAVRLALVNTTE
ncbi:MAG: hypothetical protein MUC87_21995 [Bacteroidia bacterium]|jgi:hypothetical protein|nr:hypothetical protein [Bacteroidia bacterium]